MRLATVITVPSAYLKRTFEQHQLDAHTVPNMIDLDRFKYCPRSRLMPRLVVSRNLEPMYNIKMALCAYEIIRRRYPDARLEILGSGSEEKSLIAWAKERGLEGVVFYGAVSPVRVPEFLNRADILLNPTNVDNFPLSLVEAFACGLAVVSTNVGGIPDLVGESGAALLVSANDAEEMAAKVMELLADRALAERTISAGRRLAEKHDWKMVRRTFIFSRVLRPRSYWGACSDGA